MDTYYLVDYENVGSGGVSKCGSLEKTDHLHIFYTENSKKIDLDIVDNHGNAAFETHKVPTKSQSVDMHIVSYMGYLIGKHLGGNIKIVIISKDKGILTKVCYKIIAVYPLELFLFTINISYYININSRKLTKGIRILIID